MRPPFQSRLRRARFNFFPAYRRTGGRVTHVADDFSEVRVELPLTWKTRNLWGTLFGGSMYGAVDPIFVVMLARLLGPDYSVWDKAASIAFRRPGRSTLYAKFAVDEGEVAAIREAIARDGKVERHYEVDLVDGEGVVHASCDKTISIRKRGNAAA